MSHSDAPSRIALREFIGSLKLLRKAKLLQQKFAGLPAHAFELLAILMSGGGCITLHEISSGDGGDLIAGQDNVRPFNTIITDDTGEVVDEGGGRFLFPAGVYKLQADLPGLRVGAHIAWLRVDPAGTNIMAIAGRSETAQLAGGPTASDSHTHIDGVFTLTEPTSIEVQHRCAITKTGDGMGNAVQPAGSPITSDFVHGIAHFTKTA